MKNNTKILKLIITFILLLSINTSAVTLSDNDGAAFITKAEFDSLKNDFQSQINQYNTTIDSKIDEAIAAYLAGIRVSVNEEQNLELVSSVFEYPLSIYMNNTEFAVSDYNNWVYNSCFKPDYDWTFTFERSDRFGQARLQYSNYDRNNNKLKWFFNGKRDGDNFVISDQLSNARIKFKGCFNLMNTSKTSTNNLSAAVFMDQTSKGNENSKGTSYTRSNIRNDYYYNFLSKNVSSNKPVVEFVDNWGYTSGPNLSDSTKKFQVVSGNNVWIGLTNASNDWIDGEITYDVDKLNKLFMYSSSSNQVVSPVAYNKDVYITNKDKQKQDTNYNISTYLYRERGNTGEIYYIPHVVDPGWCLEPENYGSTSRSWYLKSLIDPKRLVYNYTLPISRTIKKNHQMIAGVPLTEVPTLVKNTTYDYLYININLTRSSEMKTANLYPKIIFFTAPNTVYTLSEVSGDEYLDISSNDKLTSSTKTYTLNDGVNGLYVGNANGKLKGNEVIYYKILWNSSLNTNCSIAKPVVTLYKTREN